MRGGTKWRRSTRSRRLYGGAMFAMCASFAPFAFAQGLNNQPWGSQSGAVISPAGRQLLLNEALYGIRPRHVAVGPDGSVLFITKGPGGIAVATDTAGSNYAGALRNWTPYFARPIYSGGWTSGQDDAGAMVTTMTISEWTSAVGPGYEPIFANLLLPQGQNTVAAWVWQVYWLSDYPPIHYEMMPAPSK